VLDTQQKSPENRRKSVKIPQNCKKYRFSSYVGKNFRASPPSPPPPLGFSNGRGPPPAFRQTQYKTLYFRGGGAPKSTFFERVVFVYAVKCKTHEIPSFRPIWKTVGNFCWIQIPKIQSFFPARRALGTRGAFIIVLAGAHSKSVFFECVIFELNSRVPTYR